MRGKTGYFWVEMKIFEVEQIREIDQYTIQNEPVSALDLMERAAAAFAHEIK